MPADDPLSQLRSTLPLRDLPADERAQLGIPRQGRSRPRVIAPAPAPTEDTYLADVDRLRSAALAVDPVLRACDRPERDERVLDATLLQVATECEALAFDRVQAERRGIDVSAICSRRVAALTSVASLVCERARVGGEVELDVRGAKFLKTVDLFNETLLEVATDVMGSELASRFVANFMSRVEGWKDRLE